MVIFHRLKKNSYIYIITAWKDKQNTVANSFFPKKKSGCGSGTHLKFAAILKYIYVIYYYWAYRPLSNKII